MASASGQSGRPIEPAPAGLPAATAALVTSRPRRAHDQSPSSRQGSRASRQAMLPTRAKCRSQACGQTPFVRSARSGFRDNLCARALATGDSSWCASRSNTRLVAARSRAVTPLSVPATADSTVPRLAAFTRAPRAVRRRTARRRSRGSSTRSSHRCATSRCNTPVNVLGCTCRMAARSPAETPGKIPTTRSASLCGPVTPRSPAIRFEVFSSPCTTAHNNCMN